MSSAPALRAWKPASFAEAANGIACPAGGADAELEARRREAERSGYAEGMAAARAEAARLSALLAAAERALHLFEERLAGALLDLAVDIARRVIQSELAVRREALLPVAREALALIAQDARAVRIHAHPADAELLRAHLAEEIERGGWRVVDDPRIEPGGLRLVSSAGEVDATLATRWRRVLAALGQDHHWHDESV